MFARLYDGLLVSNEEDATLQDVTNDEITKAFVQFGQGGFGGTRYNFIINPAKAGLQLSLFFFFWSTKT